MNNKNQQPIAIEKVVTSWNCVKYNVLQELNTIHMKLTWGECCLIQIIQNNLKIGHTYD